MRNIAIAVLFVLTLIWLFFSYVLLNNADVDEPHKTDDKNLVTMNDQVISKVDARNLSLLFGIEYKEDVDVIEVQMETFTVVEIGLVVIYTSDKNDKIRLSTLINDETKQFDMVLGDTLYGYTLTVINPSSAELANGDDKLTLQFFKPLTISVIDLSKEVSDSL